jgi:hypothetical protein
MRKITLALCLLALGGSLASHRSATAIPFRPNTVFLEAQSCRIKGTVDFGCYQRKLARFEQFVLHDDAPWLEKSIVAEALVKYYDASHVSSDAATAIKAKAAIYNKAFDALDKSEQGEIDDCKDEADPDGCLKVRYCFKEAYIKVKNVLVTNEPERFQAEIKWFDKEVKGNC